MSQDIFLKLNGIDGESQDAVHASEIDITSWTWEVTQDSTMRSGSGGGAGKSTVADITLTHNMDRSSPNLAKYCFTGKHISEAISHHAEGGWNSLQFCSNHNVRRYHQPLRPDCFRPPLSRELSFIVRADEIRIYAAKRARR